MQPEDDAREMLIGIYQTLRSQSEVLYEVVASSMALTQVLASNRNLLDAYQREKAVSDRALAPVKHEVTRCIDEALARLRAAMPPVN
jgi:hypothetical protein